MASTLTNQIEQYRLRVENSQVGQFLRWWSHELRELLPERWRERLLPPKRAVLLKLTADELSLDVVESGQRQQLVVLPLKDDPRLHEQKLDDLLAERELLQSPRELLIEEDMVLTIPRGSRDDMEAVVTVVDEVHAPFDQGEALGELKVTLSDGKEILVPLVALNGVQEAGFFAALWDTIMLFFLKLTGGDPLAL